MSILLYRVDERLIHGQVVIGWGGELHPDTYVVVDDVLAETPWEQELYTLGLPAEVDAEFMGVEAAVAALDRLQSDASRTILLTRDVETMRRLAESGRLGGAEVNIGGLHHAEGRRQLRSYIHLSEDDVLALRALLDEGVTVTGQDVPGSAKVAGVVLVSETERST